MAYFRNCSKLHKGKGNILRVENIHAPTKVFTSYFECLTNFKNAGADVTNDPLSADFRRVYLSNLQNVFVLIAKCICPNCKMYLSPLQNAG